MGKRKHLQCQWHGRPKCYPSTILLFILHSDLAKARFRPWTSRRRPSCSVWHIALCLSGLSSSWNLPSSPSSSFRPFLESVKILTWSHWPPYGTRHSAKCLVKCHIVPILLGSNAFFGYRCLLIVEHPAFHFLRIPIASIYIIPSKVECWVEVSPPFPRCWRI